MILFGVLLWTWGKYLKFFLLSSNERLKVLVYLLTQRWLQVLVFVVLRILISLSLLTRFRRVLGALYLLQSDVFSGAESKIKLFSLWQMASNTQNSCQVFKRATVLTPHLTISSLSQSIFVLFHFLIFPKDISYYVLRFGYLSLLVNPLNSRLVKWYEIKDWGLLYY